MKQMMHVPIRALQNLSALAEAVYAPTYEAVTIDAYSLNSSTDRSLNELIREFHLYIVQSRWID